MVSHRVERLDEGEEFVKKNASPHGPNKEDDRVDLSRGGSGRRRAGAPSAHDEADAEQDSPDDLCAVDGRHQKDPIKRNHADTGQVRKPEKRGDQCGEHDFHHRHVGEVEDAGKTTRAAKTRAFEGKAKTHADDERQQEGMRRTQRVEVKECVNHAIAS